MSTAAYRPDQRGSGETGWRTTAREEGVATLQRAFAVLEEVSASGSISARELSERLSIPLPSVYRLLNELVAAGYLVHLRAEHSFELGHKVFGLGLSLQRRIVAPSPVRRVIDELHRTLGMAAYFAVYRGLDVVLTYLSDCPSHPRLTPLRFGFHEAAHATAFGKIMLGGMSAPERDAYFEGHSLRPLTPRTITERETLEAHLLDVATRGLAWEQEEFVPGQTCAAVGVRNGSGLVIGSVAVSMPARNAEDRPRQVESCLREYAGHASRYLRSGSTQLGSP
ncbi:IclR family transcriptional regulator [Sediminivirga luteola]|uniref:Transcriptional regulator n=1 Tax=Sediminivirga luteola TaxID=1774748 RepID=A0A8J2TVG8_9MICO|nr:IclR family transcriptional regulator [Sediminivirga luteola]GGA04635.1 transcriptional regulator [Sediminivirga luteola]